MEEEVVAAEKEIVEETEGEAEAASLRLSY